MRCLLILLFSLLATSALQCQIITFNKEVNFATFSGLTTDAVLVDSAIFLLSSQVDTAIVVDSLGNEIQILFGGNTITSVDQEGNVLALYKNLIDSLDLNAFCKEAKIIDNKIISVGYGNSPSSGFGFILFWDVETKLFSMKKFYKPLIDFSSLLFPNGFHPTSQGNFIVTTTAIHNENFANDIGIVILDSLGNELNHKVFLRPDNQTSLVIQPRYDDQNSFLVGGFWDESTPPSQPKDFRMLIYEVDTAGNLIDEWISTGDTLYGGIDDFYQLSDGSLIVAGTRRSSERADEVNVWIPTGVLLKLSPEREVVWEVEVGEPLTQGDYMEKVVPAIDGGGYIGAGHDTEYNYNNQGTVTYGILVKVSETGERLWRRRFHYLEPGYDRHAFYDLDITPDGGYLMTGQVRYNSQFRPDSLPRQRGYIVKTDEFGCVVPDCQLTNTNVPIDPEPFDLKLYPNPASDQLSIFLRTNTARPHRGTLFDARGRSIKQFSGAVPEVTYFMDVGNLAAGVYFLRVELDGRVRTEQVVITR